MTQCKCNRPHVCADCESVRKPHIHAETIKAWADGAEIEYYSNYRGGGWRSVIGGIPYWSRDIQYRVKPQHPHQDLIEAAKKGDKTIQFQGALGTGEWYSLADSLDSEFQDGVPSHVVLRRAHKWQKEIDAQAAGKEVQYRPPNGNTWRSSEDPRRRWWFNGDGEYRIKPEEVVVRTRAWMDQVSSGGRGASAAWKGENGDNNLELTFENGKLIKAEVL